LIERLKDREVQVRKEIEREHDPPVAIDDEGFHRVSLDDSVVG
jgi:hypothetical protein